MEVARFDCIQLNTLTVEPRPVGTIFNQESNLYISNEKMPHDMRWALSYMMTPCIPFLQVMHLVWA